MIMGSCPLRRPSLYVISEDRRRHTTGATRPRRSRPTAIAEHASLLGGDRTGRTEDLGVAVAQGPRALDDSGVVPAPVTESPVTFVPEPPVQFDPGVELVVVDVDPDGPLTRTTALPPPGRQAVGSFHLT